MLEAGKELDLLIAKNVMYWSVEKLPSVKDDGIWASCEFRRTTLPEYSTNTTAAHKVLNKLREKFRIDITLDKKNIAVILYDPEGFVRMSKFIGNAETFELAVCRAALLSVGEEI
jgi:hypothetical protein